MQCVSLTKLLATACVLPVICCCLATHAALTPLPGTLLVSSLNDGLVRQYDAGNGQFLGDLQVRIGQTTVDQITAIGVLNGSIYCSASIFSQGTAFGILNPVSGTISVINSDGAGNIDDSNGLLLGGDDGRSMAFLTPELQYVSGLLIQPIPGTYSVGNFPGKAATSNRIVTSYYSYWDEVQFWNFDGEYRGRRAFNNPVSTYAPSAIEYDEVTQDLWFIGANGAESQIKRYRGGEVDPSWTVNVPTAVLDAAYIPIPTPTTLTLFTLFTLSTLPLATRRRR